MKKSILLLAFALMLIIIPIAKAPTGTIRIDPALPLMLESPADFEIWVQGAGNPTTDPHILLVMTEACYAGLTGDVVVTWTGGSVSFSSGEFNATSKPGYVPPSGTTEGGRYTVASLQDHIGVPSSEMIYYAYKPFLDGPLVHDPKSFTVTLPSTDPRMLVYAIGKTGDYEDFNSKVPPTIPGFVVPELASILLVIASFSAFILYLVRPKRYH